MRHNDSFFDAERVARLMNKAEVLANEGPHLKHYLDASNSDQCACNAPAVWSQDYGVAWCDATGEEI